MFKPTHTTKMLAVAAAFAGVMTMGSIPAQSAGLAGNTVIATANLQLAPIIAQSGSAQTGDAKVIKVGRYESRRYRVTTRRSNRQLDRGYRFARKPYLEYQDCFYKFVIERDEYGERYRKRVRYCH